MRCSCCFAQVITKLASIHLTPEKPRYDGGAWHVEGMVDDGIVATGIHYFDQENIKEDDNDSALAFRAAVCGAHNHNHNLFVIYTHTVACVRDTLVCMCLSQILNANACAQALGTCCPCHVMSSDEPILLCLSASLDNMF